MHFYAALLSALMAFPAPAVLAASLDTLLSIDVDGQPRHVQHTISSDGQLVIVELPAEARFPHAHFTGPENRTFAHAWAENPTRLTLWSGSATLRYSLSDVGAVAAPGGQTSGSLRADMIPPAFLRTLNIEDGELAHWRLTLIFPSSLRPIDWQPIDTSGTWTLSGRHTLSWQQSHGRHVPLRVRLAFAADERPTHEDPCDADATASDACAPDTDADGVPDHRDLCLKRASEPVSSQTADAVGTGQQDEFGCPPTRPLRLQGIDFQAGQSYLDIGSRRILDRLAAALMHFEDRRYQVGAHTDSEGSDSYNRSLSKMRAEAVRRYLMLRGIAPDRLQAAGYGEDYPRRGNDSVAGRRANRRVELKRLD